jgi:transposase
MFLSQIDKKIFKFLLKNIEERIPNLRKSKYTNEYYLKKIIFILKTGISYRDATDSNIKNHYSSIFKKFKQWNEAKIFENLYDELIKKYKRKIKRKIHKSQIIDLFIDSTMIRNKNGKDVLSVNYQDKFKNGNKITVIVDNNLVPLFVDFEMAKVAEIKILEKGINNNKIKMFANKTNLIADAGYISKVIEKRLGRRNIKFITQFRKNQKKTNTRYERRKLKKRSRIERFFASLKQFKRIQLRYDSKLENFKCYTFIAFVFLIIRNSTT